MRIVIDLQGAQTKSRFRGIGRYSLSLAKAIVSNRGEHEVFIALNGLFPDTIEPIRAAFDGLLPQENIRVWYAPGPVRECEPGNNWRREAAERIREAFLANLQPDIVHITSLFEGYEDDAETSIASFDQKTPTIVTLYDLIPFQNPDQYLRPYPNYEQYYLRKVEHLKRASAWFAISAYSAKEGCEVLGLKGDRVFNISSASDLRFKHIEISLQTEEELRQRHGITRPFVLYAGGEDRRKNLHRLIRAYALLSSDLRKTHQLVLTGKIVEFEIQALKRTAKSAGLDKDELVFTGYVTDNDLVLFYNLCKLFVFPSWYEGFGLPALEAMSCDAPVIAANTSSLPEIMGRDDSMFDPFSEEIIAAKIGEVLTNDDFRSELIRHGADQAKKFSWDKSAKWAIEAYERLHSEHQMNCKKAQLLEPRLKLAYISPLPPERSGIADYSAELLPELARYYDIEVIVTQPDVSDPWIKACLPVRQVEWFIQHINRYDRLLYHIGNSPFHQHMFDLLYHFPGVVVLHDFFLSSVKAHLDLKGQVPGTWVPELYASHGYAAVWERFHVNDSMEVVFKYPCNFTVLQNAMGVIVHSAYSISLAQEWYGEELAKEWVVIPLLRSSAKRIEQITARQKLGLEPDDLIICSLGLLNPIKGNHRLLNAWLNSRLAQDPRCRLVFVGENEGGDYGRRMLNTIRQSGLGDRIRITGWSDADTFRYYLAAADIAVQLRTLSRGETSASILDCLNYSLPTIVNANGSIAELPKDAVWMLPDEFEDTELIEALETLWLDAERRHALGTRAREMIMTRHTPRACAEQYAQAIESFYSGAKTGRQALVEVLAGLGDAPDDATIKALASAIVQNMPFKRPAHQLLVDISGLVQRDLKTGIERVARSILEELLLNPPTSYRVEPVYATADRQGYRYARDFTLRLLKCPAGTLADDPIEAYPGDIFLGLELQSQVVPVQLSYLESFYHQDVKVYFVVYDLLPILMPHYFPQGTDEIHAKWLNAIAQFDGALCISMAVADDISGWMKTNGPKRLRPVKISWFYLGADVENSVPTLGLPEDAQQTLDQLAKCPSFLMVGTIEPRKGYLQTIDAFDCLWKQDLNVNLVIVGSEGWKSVPDEMRRTIPKIVKKLRNHPELGKRLFWLEGISDEYLEKVYAASTCLIASSEGEGFGLPLIEAAQHKLPIIARDILVFREVAGEHAFYFSGKEPDDLAKAILEWLELYRSGRHPKSDEMPWLTWKQSTQQLLEVILRDNWHTEWMPEKAG